MEREEKPASFYTGKGYLKNKSKAFNRYKPLYEELINLLPPPKKCPEIIDLGCGVGFFAKIVHQKGYKNYTGIDFSEDMLKHARKNAPKYNFMQLDLNGDLNILKENTLFTAVEVLEHLKNDCEVIKKLPRGSTIIGSVPSAYSTAHVRVFTCSDDVSTRYSDIIDFDFLKEKHVRPTKGGMFVMFRGIIK